MSYFDHRHGHIAIAGLRNALKILDATDAHLEKAGCEPWIRAMIRVDAYHLESLRVSAERSIQEAKRAELPEPATAPGA